MSETKQETQDGSTSSKPERSQACEDIRNAAQTCDVGAHIIQLATDVFKAATGS